MFGVSDAEGTSECWGASSPIPDLMGWIGVAMSGNEFHPAVGLDATKNQFPYHAVWQARDLNEACFRYRPPGGHRKMDAYLANSESERKSIYRATLSWATKDLFRDHKFDV